MGCSARPFSLLSVFWFILWIFASSELELSESELEDSVPELESSLLSELAEDDSEDEESESELLEDELELSSLPARSNHRAEQ